MNLVIFTTLSKLCHPREGRGGGSGLSYNFSSDMFMSKITWFSLVISMRSSAAPPTSEFLEKGVVEIN